MGRLLVLVLIVVLAVWLVRRALRGPRPKDPAGRAKSGAGELVSCARCGLNLPREEARESGGALFCSEEHARLGRAS